MISKEIKHEIQYSNYSARESQAYCRHAKELFIRVGTRTSQRLRPHCKRQNSSYKLPPGLDACNPHFEQKSNSFNYYKLPPDLDVCKPHFEKKSNYFNKIQRHQRPGNAAG